MINAECQLFFVEGPFWKLVQRESESGRGDGGGYIKKWKELVHSPPPNPPENGARVKASFCLTCGASCPQMHFPPRVPNPSIATIAASHPAKCLNAPQSIQSSPGWVMGGELHSILPRQK